MRELGASFGATCLLVSLLAAAGEPAAAAEFETWHKYENRHFEAFSDAPEQKVRKLLQDLESFRAATMQLSGDGIPQDSPRTRLVIFASTAQFRATIGNDSVDAFTAGVEGTPHIVMALGKAQDWARITVRHEFIHVLQGYSGAKLPSWYFEGFAEFMSGMVFRRKHTEFVVGGPPVRKKSKKRLVDWDRLVSSDFSFQQLGSDAEASNAYMQAALLVRHLRHRADGSGEDRLATYLDRYAAGEVADNSFAAIFGNSAAEIGPLVYKQRRKKHYATTYRFDADARDPDFSHAVVEAHVVEQLVDTLQKETGR